MLMPDRDAIFEAMTLQLPDLAPLEGIESLLDGLGKDSIGFPFDEINRIIFRGLVDGISAEELLARIGNDFDLSENRSRLEAHIEKVAASDLFFSLFSESPLRPAF